MIRGILLSIIMTLAFVCVNEAVALSVDTHRQINEHIAENTFKGFSLNTALINKLGFSDGKEQKLNGRAVKLILGDGGEYEDLASGYFPYIRSFNHFLDPVSNAGLFWPFDSAATWATRQPAQQYAGYYAWADTRSNFYLALTSESKVDRDIKFGETFRGLGQLMHLVTDMSVPEHTRLDIHLQPIDYEHYVNSKISTELLPTLTPIYFGGTLSDGIVPLFDSGQYDGTKPGVTNNANIGLAEFSNANFFSDDTIFSNFAYPSRASVQKTWPDARNRQYLEKTGDGVPVKHLAAISALYQYRELYFPQFSESLPLGLDDVVYKDYASLLIPRAVGYSADMLKYFFRGDIALENDPAQGYIVRNKSNEPMNGEFSVYYDYRGPGDAQDVVNRKLLASVNKSISPGQTAQISFNPPVSNDNETVIESNKYIVAFKGTIGAEQNTAVAGWVGSVGSKEPWEDWEKGLSGKHGWTVDYSFGGSPTCKFSVVDSVNSAKKTKVLKIVDTNPYSTWATLDADVQDIPDSPTKVSFDYYVPSGFSSGNNWFSVDIRDDAGHWKSFYMLVGNYTGCDRNSCYKTMQTGGWQHAEFAIPIEWGMNKIKKVYIFVDDYSSYPRAGFEMYMDNIDIK